jgi:predicted kinase
MLIILSGLPGTGKTSIAFELARDLGAVHVRIDSIEQALKNSGLIRGDMNDAGYRVGYAVAHDNLLVGRIVIADSVNPIQLTRDAWSNVAARAHVSAVEIEIQCSDFHEHRRRIQTRVADVSGLRLPTWKDVISREFEPWSREHLIIDTSGSQIGESVALIKKHIVSKL